MASIDTTNMCSHLQRKLFAEDGEIVDNYYSLIRPIPNYYNARCSEVNGLHFDDTNGAPEFPDVWMDAQRKIHEYFPYIEFRFAAKKHIPLHRKQNN